MKPGEAMGEKVLTALKSFLHGALLPIDGRVKALESRAPEKGEKGDAGKDGVDGKDGISITGKDGLNGKDGKDGDAGEDGKDGVSITLADVQPLVDAAFKSVPPPKDGNDGRDGKDGSNGIDGKDGSNGIDGKNGADGLSVKGDSGKDGADGKAGTDGRDAWAIEIIEPMQERSYPRGTYAAWRGGLIRSLRTTEPLDDLKESESPEKCGWHVVLNGIASISVTGSEDGRSFVVRTMTTSSKVSEQTIKTAAQIYRGVWKEGAYERGDTVTWGGSTWVATKDTQTKPDTADSDWKLSVKRGRDGKDGKDGKQGDHGPEGKAGGKF